MMGMGPTVWSRLVRSEVPRPPERVSFDLGNPPFPQCEGVMRKRRSAMQNVRSIFDKRPRTAFVLGGGGNLGSIQVGQLRALLERDITPDVVIGCSVGSLNGAALAADPSLATIERMA